MTVELLRTLSTVSYIIAGVLLLVAVALFFLLNVPKLYGDVSGKTAKKAIEAIRQQNETTGNKAYKPSAVNAERGKITDKISVSGNLPPQTAGLPVSVGTERIESVDYYNQSNETTVLNQAENETTVLQQQYNETTILNSSDDQTELLNNGYEPQSSETTLLINNQIPAQETFENFSVDVEMSFAGSAEIIE